MVLTILCKYLKQKYEMSLSISTCLKEKYFRRTQDDESFQEETSRNSEMSEVMLPQSVRDSLRKYLKPLLSALKPLTKSVPGLPGLDYPILSVVPYTNFYCSNMPWPGFYADTEARCQVRLCVSIFNMQSIIIHL